MGASARTARCPLLYSAAGVADTWYPESRMSLKVSRGPSYQWNTAVPTSWRLSMSRVSLYAERLWTETGNPFSAATSTSPEHSIRILSLASSPRAKGYE